MYNQNFIQEYADTLKMEFLETSAKTAHNVEDTFFSMAMKIKEKKGTEFELQGKIL